MNPAPETEGYVLIQPETVAATIEILEDALAATEADLWRDDERGGDGFYHNAHYRAGEVYERLPDAVACGEFGVAQQIVGMAEAMV